MAVGNHFEAFAAGNKSAGWPRSAYIHTPFCRHHCGYCNFTVVAGRDDLIDAYLEALACELSLLRTPREVDTLFIGGGTPTHLPPPKLRRLLEIAAQWHPPAAGYEWTVEANPADLTREKIDLLAEMGVTRLSIGAQSFDAGKLRLLERDHSAERIERAVELARGMFHSISLDLIFAAPGETLPGWRRDLRALVALAPDHVSTYGLTYEQGARFWGRLQRGEIQPADEEVERAMYESAIHTLAEAGLAQYEVSNFAQPGHRCRHNEAYWSGREYFAAGPGACRFVHGARQTNHRSTTTWLRRVLSGESPVSESETLAPEDRARERLVFGLRMLEGVDRRRFAAETGYKIETLCGAALRRLAEWGMIEVTDGNVRLTLQGLMVSDSIWPELL